MKAALLAGLALAACRKGPPPPAPMQQRQIQIETPLVDKSLEAADADPQWLSGTWQKQGESRWFLFNLPSDVAELKGKPARVVRRGQLVVHGAFVDAIFEGEELHFEASRDRSELRGPGVYRRGSPP